MNVLQRITELRKERGLTEYQLAELSGLRQSTISSWYHKDIVPTVSSIQKICKSLGITLSQFFAEDEGDFVKLNPKQLEILNRTAKLNPEQVDALIAFIDSLSL